MTNKPYSALATVYEGVMLKNDYDVWGEYLISLLAEHSKGKNGLDMACGSGYFTRVMKRSGYLVDGVDLSEEMLNEAVGLSRKEGLNLQFRKGDMSTYKNFKKVDFITVVNDGINYIPQEKLLKTFKNFYSLLNGNGVLIFDISSEYKLKKVIGNNVFSEDEEDMTYVWFNKLSEDKVDMDISVFIKRGDVYIKKEETQTEYIHSVDKIVEVLQKSGYKTVIAKNFMGGKVENDSLRIQFIAKKD